MKKPKLVSSMRAKLFSAVAMLLVAVIMVVSSTYAWFTLSTAPEVTGMTTAIGANGSLEMALLPTDGMTSSIKSEVGDSGKAAFLKNVTWGNSVDLSDDSSYGLNKILLMPAALNETNGILGASILKTPTYGADGRVDELIGNTSLGNFNSSSFIIDDDFGIRAVGVASGLTDRQLAYRNAKSAASTNMILAINAATVSLESKGSALANIAIQHAADANALHDADDVAALKGIVNDLLGTDTTIGVLEYIEQAYMQYLLAYAAGSAYANDELTWKAVQGAIEDEEEEATLSSVFTALGVSVDNLPDGLKTPIKALQATIAEVKEAQTDLNALTGTEFTWAQLSTPLNKLADTDSMKINGFAANTIKANMSELVSSVTSQGGLTVEMGTGGGVYADVADHCGDYSASINIEKVEYNGIVLNNMAARMQTKTTVPTPYLEAVGTALTTISAAPSDATTEAKPLTEFYGYIIDLAFRTNAAESDLLLQTEALDRIYGSDNSNEDTMGHGSSMTFKATSASFTNEDVKDLMRHIRIVFFTPNTSVESSVGTVLAVARLDVDNATTGADGVTAKMYLYGQETTILNLDAAENVVDSEGNILYYYKDADGKYYDDRTGSEGAYEYSTPIANIYDAEGVQVQTTEKKLTGNDAVITALTQNTATAVSALVYLDGETMTNADVGADAATSLTGKMNLQFASSAKLVPMEYADLHQPGGNSETTATTTYNVTATAAADGAKINKTDKATAGSDYTFSLADVVDGTTYTVTYSVGGTDKGALTASDGVYTIPSANITGDIAITVTANS